MIDTNVAQRGHFRGDLEQDPQATVGLPAHVIEDNVVNAVALASAGGSARVGKSGTDHHAIRHVTDAAESQRQVRGFTKRTAISLILWSEQNGESGLRKSAPRVFQDITLKKNSLPVF